MRFLHTFLILFLAFSSIAQEREGTREREVNQEGLNQRTILDDTTKIIYGMKTTSFISKENFLLSDTLFLTLDSTLNNIYDISIPEKNQFKYQNLGNLGSPVRNIFYDIPNSFSLQSGLSSLQSYIDEISTSKFYDTKSPFIDLGLYFGGLGRSKVDFEFSRNVNKNWNLTLAINRISSDKQIGAIKNKGDKNIKSSSLKFNIFHKSNNKKISHFTDIITLNHNILGTGGVDLIVDSLPIDFFLYKDFEVRLTEVESIYKNLKLETYTDYKLSNEFKFYNQTKYKKEYYGYEDLNLSLNFNFYDSFSNNIATQDSFKIKNISNRIGIKGNSKLFNYDIYGNFGYIKYHVNALENSFSEIYVGGLLKYKNPNFDIVSNFEIKKSSDYRLKVDLKSKIFEASYLSALYEPKIFERIYLGNHYSWENNFNSSFVNNLNAKINLENRFITFSPSINLYTIKNHIYFVGDNHLQADQVISFNQFIVDLKLKLLKNKINFDNKFTYNISSNSARGILNFPRQTLYSKLYYNGIWFNNTIPVQLGTIISYRSEFYGDAYDPITQNFYVQNEFMLERYLRFDLFFTMQVNNLRIFLKMNHFNQFDSFDGYFVTPYYPAQKKVLDLGVRWYFFN
tara:strand:+ start:978 stop:2852 length:1875 start_codon:yes stop_codon:yes gene_type:complete